MKKSLGYYLAAGALFIAGLFCTVHSLAQGVSDLSNRINSADSGDTIYIDAGTYTDVNVSTNKKFARAVVIRPKVLGAVTFTGAVSFKLNNSSNIKFEGFIFRETSGSVFLFNNSNNIEIANNYFYKCGINPNHSIIRIVNGSGDNKIDFNTFEDTRSQAVLIGTYANKAADRLNTGNKIFRNRFCNVKSIQELYPSMGKNGLEQIVIGFLPDYVLKTDVYQNLFENIIGDGWEVISNKSSGNTIRENTFLNCKSGLSIRGGSNVKIIDNYLDNAEKGIRIFGDGHTINNNYILNSDVGIRLPSTDFQTGAKALFTGYYQQDNVSISDNFIINPKSSDILMGENGRKLKPKGIRIAGNRIYYSNKKQILKANKNLSIKSIADNQYVASESGVTGSTNTKSIWFARIADTNKLQPFVSNDARVGKTWK